MLYSWQAIRVSPVGFAPYLSLRASAIYFHILSFHLLFSCPLPLRLELTVTLSLCERLSVCVPCQAAAGFVYSAWASCLHTTRTALIWNDQNHIDRVKPRLPQRSLTGGLRTVWRPASNWDTLQIRHMCLTEEKRHVKINILKHNHLASLVVYVICEAEFCPFSGNDFPGYQSNCLKVFLVSKICHQCDRRKAVTAQNVGLYFFSSNYFNFKHTFLNFKAFSVVVNGKSLLIYILLFKCECS